MTRRQQVVKARIFNPGAEGPIETLRRAAAEHLCTWHEHVAGGGSEYITIGDRLKLRFADHDEISAQHDPPDFNFIDGISDEEAAEVLKRISYPPTCKKTAFAVHVGLTAPKLRKLLPPDQFPDCYDEVCENLFYSNTFTQVVRVEAALAVLAAQGITTRIPISQESYSEEDYAGR